MFNPDEPQEINKKKPYVPPEAGQVVRIMTEQESFRHYLKTNELVFRGHGLGFKDGRPVVVDAQALAKVTGWRKDILRQVWKELHEAGRKKEGLSSPPLP